MARSLITAQATATATGAQAAAALDISGITGDFTIHLRIQALSAVSGTPSVSIQLEDSVNAFVASLTQAVIQWKGTVVSPAGQAEEHFEIRKYQLPNLRAGTASATLRTNVTVLGGTTPSVTYDAWVEF